VITMTHQQHTAERRYRTALLKVNRDHQLSVTYSYDPRHSRFELTGDLRLGLLTVVGVSHVGPDDAAEREVFLAKVLDAALVSPRRARRALRHLRHLTE
jgi:hypothetical protein